MIQQAVNSAQTPLALAAPLSGSGATEDAFTAAMQAFVGDQRPFASASLWRLTADGVEPIATVGVESVLGTRPDAEITQQLRAAAASPAFTVLDLLDAATPAIGYVQPSPSGAVIVYAEAHLPADRRSQVQEDQAFSDLDHALYLGDTQDADRLLFSNVDPADLPLRGRTETAVVPFGTTSISMVLSPTADLGGTLLAALPWVILAIGSVLTAAGALLTDRLQRRREQAEDLADDMRELAAENARLAGEQRSVAQTLQRSLLPDRLPEVPGVAFAARYEPGIEGVDVGGDWYDVMRVDDERLFVVIGDVSGRGVAAAAVMGSIRYAMRAYAAQGDPPDVILGKMRALVSVTRHEQQFATVLCGVVDVARGTATFANAGHPAPLLVHEGTAEFVAVTPGVPVGVTADGDYPATTIEIPDGATLVAFTDGIFERRGEDLDERLEVLRAAACGPHDTPDALLDDIVRRLAPDGPTDDIALLAMRRERATIDLRRAPTTANATSA